MASCCAFTRKTDIHTVYIYRGKLEVGELVVLAQWSLLVALLSCKTEGLT